MLRSVPDRQVCIGEPLHAALPLGKDVQELKARTAADRPSDQRELLECEVLRAVCVHEGRLIFEFQ